MSPKSNFLWHLDNDEKSKRRLQQAIDAYVDLLQDLDELHEVGGREFRGGHLGCRGFKMLVNIDILLKPVH